ncbi:MAG: glycosyltransferase family 39 protein [Candidatus Saganbacteria bacterium]|nr:glycosyltransferase family 39 protein [Candidatus Saganbacteria bacterium]
MNMKVHAKWIILLMIACVYLGFSAYQLDLRVVMDEPWLSAPGYTLITHGKLAIPPYKGSLGGHDEIVLAHPLHFLLLGGVFKIFGLGIIQARSLSLFFGLVVIVFTYLVAENLFDQKIALLSAALVSVENLIFFTARSVRGEIFIAAFLLVSVLLFLKANEKKSSLLFFFSGLSVGGGILIHQNAIVGMIAIIILFIAGFGYRFIFNKYFWSFISGFVLILMPYLIFVFIATFPDKLGYLSRQFYLNSRVFSLFSLEWIRTSFQGELFQRYSDYIRFPYRAPIFLVSLFAIIYAFFVRNKSNKILLTIVSVHIVLFFFLVANKNVRYLVNFLPFISILIVSAVFGLFGKMRGILLNKIIPYFIIFLLIISQLFGNIIFFIIFADSGYNSFMRKIDRIIPNGTAVYGSINYWLGLYEHEYYAYQRVPFIKAKDEFDTKIFLVEDRIHKAYRSNTSGMNNYLAKYGDLIGEVSNDFYGNIRIYKLDQRNKINVKG